MYLMRHCRKLSAILREAISIARTTRLFIKWYVFTLARIRCFATFARTGGEGGATPPPLAFSKRSVLELRGSSKLSLVLGQYLTQLWQVRGQLFENSMIFQLRVHRHRVHINKTGYRSGMSSPFNSAQNEVF